MTISDDIRQQVQKRAVELVLPHVLDLEVRKHAKHGFKSGCTCEYCVAKRVATSELSHLSHTVVAKKVGELARDPVCARSIDQWELSKYARDIVRESYRQKHRAILKGLVNDES
ncbi:MAG: hypothetical protein ACKO0Z_07165 [Betaproteobacteria bacterium]